MIVQTLDAPARPSRLRAHLGRSGNDPASGGWLTRATVIDVAAPLGADEAARWLEQAGEDDLAEGIAALDLLLHAHRLAAADPRSAPLDRRQAVAARIGYGSGEEVAGGAFAAVRELVWQPPARARRRLLAPDARLAALLTAQEQPLVAEELTLRSRLDLDRGEHRHAALQLLIALDAAVAELGAAAGGSPERLTELRAQRQPVAQAAQAALTGDLPPEKAAAVRDALERLEAALRARSAGRG